MSCVRFQYILLTGKIAHYVLEMDILGLYDTLQQVVEIVKKTKARYDALQANPTTATQLIKCYNDLADILATIAEKDEQTITRFQAHHAARFNQRMAKLNSSISETMERLRAELANLEDPLYRTTHAMRTESLFAALQQDAALAETTIDSIQSTIALACVSASRSSSGLLFRPCNTTPPNSFHPVLDFHSFGTGGKRLTCEGRLKDAILKSRDGESVGAVASGMGGVGKTCALHALAYDPDIRKRFPGGVYFISLGMNATVAKLIEHLCAVVEASGGEKLIYDLRRQTELRKVLEKIRNWFYDHICLFIFDDVWCCNGIESGILEQLVILTSNTGKDGGSRLVYSTRDKSLTSLGEIAEFKPRDRQGTTASNILLRSANVEEHELHDPACEKAIKNILDMCAGLPVALGIAGRGVRWKREKWQGDRKEAWVAYWAAVVERGILDTTADCYGKLGHSLLVSLDFLDDDGYGDIAGVAELSYKEMHRSLCVLQKEDWISASVLRLIWGLKNDDSVFRVIARMRAVGVADEEYRMQNGRECAGLSLHSLVHDFASREAQKHHEVAMWHAKLLDSTFHNMNASEYGGEHWVVSLGEDNYVSQNICRLLQNADRIEDVWSLLLSAEWVVKMVRMGSFLRLEEDIRLCESYQEGDGRAHALNMVGRAARLSVPHCVDTPDCIWFQLHSRLFAAAQRCKTTRHFLAGVEEMVPGPWIKPARPCVKVASDVLIDTFMMSNVAEVVRFVDEEDTVTCGYRGEWENLIITKYCSKGERTDITIEWNAESDVAVINRALAAEQRQRQTLNGERGPRHLLLRRIRDHCRRRKPPWKLFTGKYHFQSITLLESLSSSCPHWIGCIECFAIAEDWRLVVTGQRGGLVKIWSTATGLLQGEPDSIHKGRVTCVAICANSKRAVSGSVDKAIRLWNAEMGNQEGETLEGHKSGISAISISKDGKWIVSAGEEELYVWNAETRNCMCTIELGGVIEDVAISGDGKKVACGLDLPDPVVAVVDVEKMRIHGEYRGHKFAVLSVDISADGMLVASGSGDRSVRVWDVETGQNVREFTGHTEAVSSVSISADKRRLVSGARDHTVCVWSLITTGPTDILPAGHSSAVDRVSICADGKFVISDSGLWSMGVWSVDSDEPVLWAPPIRQVSSVSVSVNKKRILLGTEFGRVCLWDTEDGRARRTWPNKMLEHSYREHHFVREAISLVFGCRRQKTVWLGEDNIARISDMTAKQPCASSVSVPTESVSSIAIQNYGNIVAFGATDGKVHLWECFLGTGEGFGEALVGHTEEICSVAISGSRKPRSSPRIASGSKDWTVRVWDCETREPVGDVLVGHRSGVFSVDITPDGDYVASGSSDCTVRVWNIDTGIRDCIVLTGHDGLVCSVAITGDGRKVVSGSEDKTVRVWDVTWEKQMGAALSIGSSFILDVGISYSGRLVRCGLKDKSVRWWDSETGKLVGVEVGGHMGEVYKLAESEDGTRMAVASRPTKRYLDWNPDGASDCAQVRVWDLETLTCIYVGEEDEWDDVNREYLGTESSCGSCGVEGGEEMANEAGFRAIGKCIAFGEGSGKMMANFEADITALDVDYKNKIIAAGLYNGLVAILRIVD